MANFYKLQKKYAKPLSGWFISMLVALMVSGCAATVLSSAKTAGLMQPVDAINVIFVETDLASQLRLVRSVESKVNQQRQELGEQILRQLPAALATANIPSQNISLAPVSMPSGPNGFQELFPQSPGRPVLLVTPVSAVTTCPNDCFQYRVQARLMSAATGSLLWMATIDLPPKASRFHDFNGVAKEFAAAIVSQLKVDGVLIQR